MKKKTILIADDEPHMALMLQFLFQDKGYSFLKAYNGEDAFEIAKTCHPDLIILDILMPRNQSEPWRIAHDEGPPSTCPPRSI